MAHTVISKYNPATGRITAKCWRASVRVEAYSTKAISGPIPAHRAALDHLLSKLNADNDIVEWFEVAAAEGINANEYTFIIDTRPALGEGKQSEYRITWEIDTTASSYEEAARWTAKTYFAQEAAPYFEMRRRIENGKFEKHPVIVDLE